MEATERSFCTYNADALIRQTVFHVKFGDKAADWGQLPLFQRITAPDLRAVFASVNGTGVFLEPYNH